MFAHLHGGPKLPKNTSFLTKADIGGAQAPPISIQMLQMKFGR